MRPLAVLVVAAVVVLLAPGSASAGWYEVHVCRGQHGPGALVLSSWQAATLRTDSSCSPAGSGGAVSAGPANSPPGATASWTLSAPPGTRLRRVDVERSLGKRDNTWDAAVLVDGAVVETCDIPTGQFSCSLGSEPGSTRTAVYSGLNAATVSFRLQCREHAGACPGRPTLAQAWINVFSALVLVEDAALPVVQPPRSSLLDPGWHRGTATVSVSASDASGLKSLAVQAGGTLLRSRDGGCEYSRMRPCSGTLSDAFELDTQRLGDGTHDLRVQATDAAEQTATVSATLRIDGTAPAKPEALVVERNADATVALRWTNPDQGSAAPIAGARYEVCGATCTTGRVDEPGITAIDSLALPSGEHTVKVWLEDQAGNVDSGNAATVTFDPSRLTASSVLDTNPPILLPSGPKPSPKLRVTSARRTGATLTLAGTVVRGAAERITAGIARNKSGNAIARASAKPKRGKWTIKVRLTPALQSAAAIYLRLTYAGQATYRRTTVNRRLAKRPARPGNTGVEFSIEAGR